MMSIRPFLTGGLALTHRSSLGGSFESSQTYPIAGFWAPQSERIQNLCMGGDVSEKTCSSCSCPDSCTWALSAPGECTTVWDSPSGG